MGKKKLLFVIHSLHGGGAERVLTNLIKHLDREKYIIYLLLFEKKGPYLSEIPGHVNIYDLRKRNKYSFINLILRVVKIIREVKPETIISINNYTNIVVGLARLLYRKKIRLVLSERSNLSGFLLETKWSQLKRILSRIALNQADIVVVNSQGSKNDLEKYFCSKKEVTVIKNPLDLDKIEELSREKIENNNIYPYLLAVGRISREKGYRCLLKAYSLINQEIPENLVILGEGEEKKELIELAEELKIQDKVFFLGFQNNPYKFMKNASLYILSSFREGFPNVLLEAMACGVPIISTNCPSGPDELIVNGENGILVPPGNSEAIAGAIIEMLKNEKMRKLFSYLGKKTVENYRLEKVIPNFEEIF